MQSCTQFCQNKLHFCCISRFGWVFFFESRFSAQKKTHWNKEYTINIAKQLNRHLAV